MNIGFLVAFQTFALVVICSGQALAENVTVLLGEDVIFPCSKESVKRHYFWYQNKKVLAFKHEFSQTTTPDRYSITDNELEYKLAIRNVKVEDEGTYSCEVSESEPGLNKDFSLTVNIPPSVRLTPSKRQWDVEASGELTVYCVAEGKPAPIVKWIRHGGKLFVDGKREKEGALLKFVNITIESDGNYTCIADNGFGEKATENVEINVRYKPTLSVREKNIHTAPGDDISIHCSFKSSPVAQTQWKFNNSAISKNSVDNVEIITNVDNEHAESILKIMGVSKKNFGTYSCSGHNNWGFVQENIAVSGIPVILDVSSGNGNTYVNQYTLEWKVWSKATILKYHLHLQMVNESTGIIIQKQFTVVPSKSQPEGALNTQAYSINNLIRNSTYIVQLQAENVVGISLWSKEFVFKTPADGEEAPTVENDNVYDIGSGSNRNTIFSTVLVMLSFLFLL